MTEFELLLRTVLGPFCQEFGGEIALVTRGDERCDALNHYLFLKSTGTAEVFSSPQPFDCVSTSVIDTGEPLLVQDLATATHDSPIMRAEGLRAYLGVPLVLDGLCVGAVEVMCKASRIWTSQDVSRALEFAEVIEAMVAPTTSKAWSIRMNWR